MSRSDNEKKRQPPRKFNELLSVEDMESHTKLLEDLYRAQFVPLDVATVWIHECKLRFKKMFGENEEVQ